MKQIFHKKILLKYIVGYLKYRVGYLINNIKYLIFPY